MIEGATLLVFADDWGRHPSSAQHLFRRFLGGNELIWVNTVGLRLPRPNRRDLGKLADKLQTWSGLKQPGPAPEPDAEPGPEILDLPLAPLAFGGASRRINAALLRRAVRRRLEARRARGPAFVVSTLPLTADLPGECPARFVYYMVDDYASWPGLSSAMLGRMDQEQAAAADLIVAASRRLAELHRDRARGAIEYLPHGVDVAHFLAAREARAELEAEADALFFGAFDERIDQGLIAALADRLPERRFLLIGPEDTLEKSLIERPNVSWRPPVSYAELPRWMARCRVALLPYVQNELAQSISPLKVREALAAGLRVVATDVPELRGFPEGVAIGRGAEELAGLIEAAIERPGPLPSVADLEADSWEGRAEQLSGWLAGLPPA